MKLIHLLSDPLDEPLSVNRRVAAKFLQALQTTLPGVSIVELDLNRDPPPFFDRALFGFVWGPVSDPAYQPSAEERAAADYMLRHAELLRDADLLLLSAPVWNHYVPAVLKAWIDQVLSPGQVFELGAEGRVPLHRVRALVSIISAGGMVSQQGIANSLFHLLRESFDYIGIERQHEILVEGQEPALYDDHRQREAQAVAVVETLAGDLGRELGA